MTTEEHLKKIKAKCESLLAIAEKRTPGRWEASDNVCTADAVENGYFITCDSMKTSMSTDAHNATFIASCAGPAEAGWRATIASVNDLLAYRDLHKDTQIEVDLLAAWPEELL